MLLEIKAELDKLMLDLNCIRNLSGIFVMVITVLFSLTELHSHSKDINSNFSGSNLARITVKSL